MSAAGFGQPAGSLVRAYRGMIQGGLAYSRDTRPRSARPPGTGRRGSGRAESEHRTLALLTRFRAAKRGANGRRSRAASGYVQPLPGHPIGTSGDIRPFPAALRKCLLSSRSRVRVAVGAQVRWGAGRRARQPSLHEDSRSVRPWRLSSTPATPVTKSPDMRPAGMSHTAGLIIRLSGLSAPAAAARPAKPPGVSCSDRPAGNPDGQYRPAPNLGGRARLPVPAPERAWRHLVTGARTPAPRIALRPSVREDAPALGAVFDAAVRAGWAYLGDLVAEPMFTPQDWDQLVADHLPPNVLLVAVDETGGVVGYTAVHPADGEMFLLFVHPAYAGRGIGRALLAAAHDALRAAGRADAFLFVHEQNESGRSPFTRLPGTARTVRTASRTSAACACAGCVSSSGFSLRGLWSSRRMHLTGGNGCRRCAPRRGGR
jgi:GNAT superfamily N-acetyltransferase